MEGGLGHTGGGPGEVGGDGVRVKHHHQGCDDGHQPNPSTQGCCSVLIYPGMVVQRVHYGLVLVQAYEHGGEEGGGGGHGGSQGKDTAEGIFLQERRGNLVHQGERGQH